METVEDFHPIIKAGEVEATHLATAMAEAPDFWPIKVAEEAAVEAEVKTKDGPRRRSGSWPP